MQQCGWQRWRWWSRPVPVRVHRSQRSTATRCLRSCRCLAGRDQAACNIARGVVGGTHARRLSAPCGAEDDPYGVKSTDSDDGLDPDEKLEYQSERQWAPKEGGEDENVWVERFDARTQRKFWWNTV